MVKKIKCEICGKYIKKTRMTLHKARHNPEPDFILVEGRLLTYQHNNQEENLDIEGYMNLVKEKAINIIRNALNLHKNIKVNLEMECEFKKEGDKYKMIEMTHKFQLSNVILREANDLENYWDEQRELFIARCDELEARESRWTLKRINNLTININKYKALSGNSYTDLPEWIKNKTACINIKNNDNECFRWSIISCLHQANDHVERLSNYNKPEFKDELNFKGIEFPVKIQDIPKFESQNKINITIFSFEDMTFYPLYHKIQNYDKNIDLLYFGNETNNHYCWIKSLSRLLNDQLEINKNKKYFCRSCLNYASRSEEALKKHQELCFNKEPCVLIMPENIFKSKNIQRMLRHPYAIYCDFESILKPIQSCKPNPEKSYTLKTQLHVPCSYGLYVKSVYNNIENPLEIYKGEDAEKCFINRITEHAKNIYKMLKKNKPITDVELEAYEKAQECYICKGEFTEKNTKVRDHDHYTGKYRGPVI